jgi:hypothetical protein
MDTEPGADERRIKALLRQRGVGPDAVPPPLPPGPPPAGFESGEDWWEPKPTAPTPDDYDEPEPDDTDTEEGEGEAVSGRFTPQPGYWPRPHMPAAIGRVRDQAPAAVSPGTRRLLYNATAAGAGWLLGLYDQFAWAINDLGKDSIGGALVLGFTGTALIAHLWDRRTRHWWTGIAWVARIPLATAICALALWAPAAP